MEGLRAAAAAVQAGEFRKTYGHLLQQPQSASPEILSQLRRASEVITCSLYAHLGPQDCWSLLYCVLQDALIGPLLPSWQNAGLRGGRYSLNFWIF